MFVYVFGFGLVWFCLVARAPNRVPNVCVRGGGGGGERGRERERERDRERERERENERQREGDKEIICPVC